MNSLLMKNRPKDMEPEKWKELWKNSHPQLQPLADTLKAMRDKEPSVRPDDFDCPNHYAKLVAEQVRKQTIQDVLDLLPDTVEK
jgi:hypothetical protein